MAQRQRHKRGGWNSKEYVPRHRGRRGNFWGDPGKGQPGTSMSRDTMGRLERSIERHTRTEGKQAVREGIEEYDTE
jgi:hypothetical protein